MDATLLDSNNTDKKIAVWKSISNEVLSTMLPVGSSFLTDVVFSFIPNQREDRIVNFLKELSKQFDRYQDKVDKLETWVNMVKGNKCQLHLLELGFQTAVETDSKILHHCYAYYIFSIIENKQIDDVQKEAIFKTLSRLNEVEILHIISLEQDKYIFEETNFHKKYGEYVDRHTACGDEEDDIFNAMQDSYLNNLVVYGIATCTGNPKNGQSSYKLSPYGQLIYKNIFDEQFFS